MNFKDKALTIMHEELLNGQYAESPIEGYDEAAQALYRAHIEGVIEQVERIEKVVATTVAALGKDTDTITLGTLKTVLGRYIAALKQELGDK